MRFALCLSLSSFFFTGCFSDLSGTKIRKDMGDDPDLTMPNENEDGGTTLNDLKGSSSDGGGNSDGGTTTPPCDLPYLAIAINGASSGGRIERIPLDGRPKCKALTLGNSLPNDLYALGFAPPSTIAVAGFSGVYQIKPDDKAAAGFWKSTASYAFGVPIDNVFPIKDPSGNQYLVVAHDTQQFSCCGNSIEDLSILNGDQDFAHWTITSGTGDIRIGSEVRTLAPSATTPGKIFAAKSLLDPQYAAAEFTPPWDGPVEVTMPYYKTSLGGMGDVRVMQTLRVSTGSGVLARTAWSFKPSLAATPYQVYFYNDNRAGMQTLVGPLTCNLPQCSKEAGDEYLDVVPDPTNTDAALAICHDKDSDTKAHVVRMKGDGTCELVFDGKSLLSPELPVRLANAILQPD